MEIIDDITKLGSGSINLRRRFPIAHRWVIKKSFLWFLAVLIVLSVVFYLFLGIQKVEVVDDQDVLHNFQRMISWAFLLACLSFIARVVYEEIYLACYHYGIEGGNLVISKGIILKTRGSFPLNRITDVYLDRTIGDFFLGLYNLHISTPTVYSAEFARIEGLSTQTAIRLQNLLTKLLEKKNPEKVGNIVPIMKASTNFEEPPQDVIDLTTGEVARTIVNH